MKTNEELIEEVKKLIGTNKTDEALKLLSERKLPAIESELILLKNRYSKVSKEKRLGISEEDDLQRKFNKINFELLDLVKLIGTKPVSLAPDSSGKKSNSKILKIVVGILFLLLAGWGATQMMKSSPDTTKTANVKNEPTTPPIKREPVDNPNPVEVSNTDNNSLGTANSNITYKVGMNHEGGKIFYVDSTGKHGLIMAPVDLPEGEVYWFNNDGPVKKSGATGKGLYDGKLNTQDIIEALGPGDYPAQLCAKYSRRGFTGWYLPSIMELNKLYEYSKQHPGEFSKSYYWSSTEIPDAQKDVYYKNFRTGQEYERLPKYNDYKKQNKARVRPIRSF